MHSSSSAAKNESLRRQHIFWLKVTPIFCSFSSLTQLLLIYTFHRSSLCDKYIYTTLKFPITHTQKSSVVRLGESLWLLNSFLQHNYCHSGTTMIVLLSCPLITLLQISFKNHWKPNKWICLSSFPIYFWNLIFLKREMYAMTTSERIITIYQPQVSKWYWGIFPYTRQMTEGAVQIFHCEQMQWNI